ncbi:MAG: radical SAM family heme chaperone HemW [Lachnospiraceae bacterium]|nr:radical SAM family heme chaperone HemW [Lachnospiraceae bacterium]
MELYLHIPFCVQKCSYCDFLSWSVDEPTKDRYLRALLNEISFYGNLKYDESGQTTAWHLDGIETVYFGGGTPSVLGADRLLLLLDAIFAHFRVKNGCEITVEINPATITDVSLEKLQKKGVNRLSIGLQSTNNTQLVTLGRVHTYEDFLEIYGQARAVGFKNLNIDLISSIPGQSVKSYQETLEEVIRLKPEHISAYSLILEEGTPFYDKYADHPELLPGEEEDREMYHLTKSMLQEAGYMRYEISNYATPGFKSKHNIGYWERIPYLGLGLGASSFYFSKRKKNFTNLAEYLQVWENMEKTCRDTNFRNFSPFEEIIDLTKKDEMSEYLFLGLRMTKGVSISGFEARFGQKMMDVYGREIEKLQKEGLLVVEKRKDRIFLTDFGMDVSNYVFEKFI